MCVVCSLPSPCDFFLQYLLQLTTSQVAYSAASHFSSGCNVEDILLITLIVAMPRLLCFLQTESHLLLNSFFLALTDTVDLGSFSLLSPIISHVLGLLQK